MIKRKLSAEPDTNGWVRRTRDGLALLLVVALALPPLWYSLGAASRLRAQRFGWEAIAGQFLALFEPSIGLNAHR